MRFKKLVFCVVAALLALTLHAGFAEAITFNLDTIINGDTSLTPGQPSFGTITFTQDGNSVDVTASLSNSNWKLLSFDFNYNPSLGSNPASRLSSGTLAINEFNIKPDGYSGYLDLSIPANGNLGNISTYITT
ncbi:MAG: hypothetical protein ABSG91_17880 [Syntrophobacteraceae bacterium]